MPFAGSFAWAELTQVVVRVKSKGAKFVGSEIGGAQITIKDLETGKILSQGKTEGTTGNTDTIMKKPHLPGEPLSDGESAKFTTAIDLREPVYVEIRARGPLQHPDSANEVAVTQWLLPGKPLTKGDGVLLELPGLAIEFPSPKISGSKIKFRAKVAMMCGCPFTPGGLWDADKLQLKGVVRKAGKEVGTFSWKYAGEESWFEGEFTSREKGEHEAVLIAFEFENGNTGLAKLRFSVP